MSQKDQTAAERMRRYRAKRAATKKTAEKLRAKAPEKSGAVKIKRQKEYAEMNKQEQEQYLASLPPDMRADNPGVEIWQTTLQPRHARFARIKAAALGFTPEMYLEWLVRRDWQLDPERVAEANNKTISGEPLIGFRKG